MEEWCFSETRFGTRTPLAKIPQGRRCYLPDSYYFHNPDILISEYCDQVATYIATIGVRWSDFFYPRIGPTETFTLRGDRSQRVVFAQSRLRYMKDQIKKGNETSKLAIGLMIEDETGWILDCHEGYPAILAFTDEEFEKFQSYCADHGLPVDLYYRSDSQVVALVVEREIEDNVTIYKRFSPKTWSITDKAILVNERHVISNADLKEISEEVAKMLRTISSKILKMENSENREEYANELALLQAMVASFSRWLSADANRESSM